MAGKLVFAGTPIGNIRDASLRLFDVIYESDIIIAEVATTCHDVLLKMGIDVWYKIQQYPNTMNFNGGSYNIDFDTKIIEEAASGKNVLFLSDFGMPCISDPGQSIISLARSTHPEIKIDVIPGPSAVVSAFVHAASNDDNEFHFYGFVNEDRYDKIIGKVAMRKTETAILFLPSYNHFDYVGLISRIYQSVGERKATVCIDLTTTKETVLRGPLSSIYNDLILHISKNSEYTKNSVYYITLVLSPLD